MPYSTHAPVPSGRVQMTAEYLSHQTFGRFGNIVRRQGNGATILLHADRQHPEPMLCFFNAGAFTEIGEQV